MTTEPMLDRRLRELMAELAAPGDQSAAIDHVISVTRALRPEPRWRALLKERPMRTNSIVIAGSPPLRFGLVFAVIALIGLLAATIVVGALVLRQPAVPPAYGPAGNGVLAFAESGDIVTTDAAGSNRTIITTGPAIDSRPLFSRDGTRIAFLRDESGSMRLVVANVDGTGLVAVSPDMVGVHAFDWSPAGDRLAVLANLDCCAAASILVLDVEGVASAAPIDIGGLEPDGWLGWRPPEGDELLFRAHPNPGSPAAGLFAIDPAGGTPRTLLEPVEAVPSDAAAVDAVALSPDGRWATFWTWGPNEQGVVNGWGHVLDLEGGSERIATTWGGSTSPISPDGQSVIGAGNGRLKIEPLDGSAGAQSIGPVLDMAGIDLAISPDGTQILATEASGTRTLIDIETGAATPLDMAPDDEVSWQRIALP